MKIKITITRMGGGYLRAVLGQTWNEALGKHCPHSVFGATEEELLERLKMRIPELRVQQQRRMIHELIH